MEAPHHDIGPEVIPAGDLPACWLPGWYQMYQATISSTFTPQLH